jgi:anti-sigma factor RsiW
LADEEPTIAQEANFAFAPIHARLMDAIEASQRGPSRTQNAERESGNSNSALRAHRSAFEWLWSSRRLPALRLMLATLVLLAVGLGGRQLGHWHTARALPVQLLVDDFDAGLRSSIPVELVADNPQAASKWLSRKLGVQVRLPALNRAGIKLLGARRHHIAGHPVAQTHYLKDGVRVALYQVHAPHYGLSGLNEVEFNGCLFFIRNFGNYHAVIWRSDDNLMALVTPLARHEALQLAAAMRASTTASNYA